MSKNLIIYYSRKGQNYWNGSIKTINKGNTEIVAKFIQKAVGGDLFEIETIKEYSPDYYECIGDAKQELNSAARPELKKYLDSINEYDNVFVCGPCWWGTYPIAALEAVNSGLVEVLMFSVNPCYDLLPGSEDCEDLWAEKSYSKPLFNLDPTREKLYETCQRLGVGITVMKVFGGGDLLSEKYSPAGKAMTAAQCIHYALTRPAVCAIMSGARSLKELTATIDYEYASDEERDYASVFASFPQISWKGHCMYCGHCAPCVKGIDIASVTKYLNLAKAQGEVPETVHEHYAALKYHAGDCIECGACEKRCPFDVEIIENMRAAKKTFGR